MFYLGSAKAPAQAKRLTFETVDETTGKVVATLKSVTDPDGLDDGSPEMSSFHKGRGIGDCGATWTWAWTGKTFRLTAYATMPDCKGISSDDWITLWRARTK
jgi:hypothetical protein